MNGHVLNLFSWDLNNPTVDMCQSLHISFILYWEVIIRLKTFYFSYDRFFRWWGSPLWNSDWKNHTLSALVSSSERKKNWAILPAVVNCSDFLWGEKPVAFKALRSIQNAPGLKKVNKRQADFSKTALGA